MAAVMLRNMYIFHNDTLGVFCERIDAGFVVVVQPSPESLSFTPVGVGFTRSFSPLCLLAFVNRY